MVQSRAATVDAYLDELPEDRRHAIERLRLLAKELLPDVEERMTYGMVGFTRSDGAGVHFASPKQYVAIYLGAEVLALHEGDLGEEDVGKGCLRFPNLARIDGHLVEVPIRDVDPAHRQRKPASRRRTGTGTRTARPAVTRRRGAASASSARRPRTR
jgi:uncharacterized protein YdhG (YjbR/CyaY superfamily)